MSDLANLRALGLALAGAVLRPSSSSEPASVLALRLRSEIHAQHARAAEALIAHTLEHESGLMRDDAHDDTHAVLGA